MHDDSQAFPAGVAHLREPAVPGQELRKQLFELGPVTVRVTGLPQRQHGTGGDWWLGDAGSGGAVSGGPYGRAGEIAGIVLPEDDMRQEAVRPLSREQGLELAPGTIEIHGSKAQRDECGIPVPLEGIHPAVRYCVSAPVVPN